MDEADAGQNSNEGRSRLFKRRYGYDPLALRGFAPTLLRGLWLLVLPSFLVLFCSFIRHSYVTWQDDPCTTATVTIHGIKTARELTLVYNGKKCTVVGNEMPLPDHRRIYHFHLTDLEPGTEYNCQVEDAYYSFKTLAKKPPYRFVEGGDWENTEPAAQLAKLAASKKPDAVLLGGDYPSNVISTRDYAKWDHWLDVYTKNFGMTPLVMAIGNHEVVGGYNQPKAQAPFFFHYFRTKENSESYYTIPLGDDLQLYILDSGHVTSHEKQQEWLNKNLQNERFKIALYHVPLYPSVRFAEKGVGYNLSLKGMKVLHKQGRIYSPGSHSGRQYWLPLFKKHQLQLAFEHHDQTLKRTKELHGTIYLGDGGWGPLKQYPPIQGYFHHYFATIKGKEHFFWLLDIDREVKITAISKENQRLDSCLLPL